MQLIFLAGIVCLIIASHLRWWPADNSIATTGYLDLKSLFDNQTQAAWERFLNVARLPLVLGYAGGIIICLWASRHTVRRIFLYVLVPSIFGISLISWRYLSFYSDFAALPYGGRHFISTFDSVRLKLWGLGPGFQVSVCGIGLILFFMSRVAFDISSLPLSLPSETELTNDDSSWTKTRLLIWLSVIPAGTFIYFAFFAATQGLHALLAHFSTGEKSNWPLLLAAFLTAWTPLIISIQIFGAAGWRSVGRSLWRCRLGYLGLSIIIAPGIEAVMWLGKYLFDYIDWGAHGYGHLAPPQFANYFELPTHLLWLLLPLVIPALTEEIIFRALLQPQLVNRYGMWRGLFFVGMVWSAFHFYSDFNFQMSVTNVFWAVVLRVIVCLTLAFVLGWLTLRSGSIWPSTISHVTYNALIYSSYRYEYAGMPLVRMALWAFLAYVLFRYWPVQMAYEPRELTPQVIPSYES
jgi:membrane protease YdiL (CAAX protease family)